MKKKLLVLLIAVVAIIVNLGAQTIVLSESFEKGIPAGWTQESVFGDQKWVTEPLVSGESLLYPDGAVSGLGRALLRNTIGESKGYKTRLITPVMNLDTVFQPASQKNRPRQMQYKRIKKREDLYLSRKSVNFVLS